MIQSKQPSAMWLQFAMAILLVLGLFFRWVNLDQKPYWHDETYTSLRISGHSEREAIQHLFKGQEIGIEDLRLYQNVSPEKSAIATVQRLATEDPHHPPLYYIAARYWAEWFGSSVAAMRSLPVLISLIGFPAIYWLCLELFASPMIGWLAVALFSVSPIYVRYAQEAREYSLWIVIILLSCAALLRAMRCQTKLSWSVYTVTMIAGLYCHLLFGTVFLAQGIYVLAIARRFNKTLISYLLSSLIGIVAFIPWLWVIWKNQAVLMLTTSWMKAPLPLLTLVQFWSVNLCRAFVSWNFQYNSLFLYLTIPILILLLVSIYFLTRKTPRRVWLFVLTLIGIPGLALILPDLLWADRRSTVDRYFLPCYSGIHLAVAYLLATQMTRQWSRAIQGRLWQIMTIAIISIGVLSCAISSQTNTWWGWSKFEVQISKIINQTSHPLVISDMPLGVVMPLSHRLNPDTHLLLLTEPNLLKIPDGFRNVFVYNPSDRLQAAIEQQGMSPELIYQFRDSTLVFSLYQVAPNLEVEHR